MCVVASADTIHLKNGNVIESTTLAEITPTEVKYRVGGREVVYTVLKDDVLKIVYSDGGEDVFGEARELATTTQLQELETDASGNSDFDPQISAAKLLQIYYWQIGYADGLELSLSLAVLEGGVRIR